MNELELILTDICKCSRIDLYLNASSIVLKDRQVRRLETILKNRARQIPIAYSLGHTEFMGLRLKVTKDVLIPRPETELLVELVVERIIETRDAKPEIRILDIGTGSGCIAIALAKSLKDVNITAIDRSKKALYVAEDNAKAHNVEKYIQFLQSDLFKHRLFKTIPEFDIIISNPPYVPTSQIGLFDETTHKEPKVALDGGLDGCDVYRRISAEAGKYLKKDGLLFLEIGYAQAKKIKEIFSGNWIVEEFCRDYHGIERICIIRKNYG